MGGEEFGVDSAVFVPLHLVVLLILISELPEGKNHLIFVSSPVPALEAAQHVGDCQYICTEWTA